MSNTQLWDAVCRTDPEHTKGFSRAGGFKGTAIKPYWLIRRATETFGPVGIGWGWEEIENQYVAGVWCSKVRLWYKTPDQAAISEMKLLESPEKLNDYIKGKIQAPTVMGQVEQWGQTQMEGTNKHGAFVDEEAPKKAVTDAVTKCLSYLGFGGDVHMGLFDDSKYVEALKAENSKQTARARNQAYGAVKEALLTSPDPIGTWNDHAPEIEEFTRQDAHFREDLIGAVRRNPVFVELLAKIENADDLDELETIKELNAKAIKGYRDISETLFSEVVATGQERKKQLNERNPK